MKSRIVCGILPGRTTESDGGPGFKATLSPQEVFLCIKINSHGSHVFLSFFTFIYSLTVGVVGAPQMTSQPVSSIFPCSPLPSGTWRTPGLSWVLSSHLSSCLPCLLPPFAVPRKIFFWPYLMNGRHDHTTSVCVSLRCSGAPLVVRLAI